MLRAEQAIFTSVASPRLKGYQLVAHSRGMPESVTRFLAHWAPSHGALPSDSPRTESLNFIVEKGWAILSRTMYGAPEYSGRGSLQVFTAILAVPCEQLYGYQYHPLRLAETALVLGQLLFRPAQTGNLPSPQLPQQPLAARPLVNIEAKVDDRLLSGVLDLLSQGHRVGVETEDPFPVLDQVLQRTSPRKRLQQSFATSLKPTQHRPFQLQIFPKLDRTARQKAQQQGICLVQ